MKISDKGLNQILSLGLLKPTESPGVYYLYSWKSVNYYCGLGASKNNLNKPGLFISLTEGQFKLLPLSSLKKSNNPQLIKISEYFGTAVFFKFDKKDKTLMVGDYCGQNSRVTALKIDLKKPSPFTIAKETKKDFHGFFSSISPSQETLKKAFNKTEKLWISASPVFQNDEFIGVVAGFTEDKEYGLDVLDLFKDFNPEAAA